MKSTLILAVTLLIGRYRCQSVSRTFSCVSDVSICNDRIIDPRVSIPGITPNAGETTNLVNNVVSPTDCPTGYTRCTSVVCGTSQVQPSRASGFSTPSSLPWQAYISSDTYGYAGGGVLLDQYHVLTAAHKVSNLTDKPAPVNIRVSLGLYSTTSTQNVQTIRVGQVWQHGGYNSRFLTNDVALLRLSTPVNFNANVRPICLPQAGANYVPTSSNCLVSGWGQTSFTLDDAPTQTLKQAYVPIVTNDECTRSYTQLLGATNTASYLQFPGELCAGGQASIDACTQDGGSPLICPGTTNAFALVGLVLWGKDCGVAGRYGVYLNVPQYLSWIQSTMQCSSQNLQTCTNATKTLQ
ncbi:chymotrypsinogen A-like [Rhynchophorus ferrugineus]|uniref:chymotrypsinogen A-like n=1 Tax=Rhynchophorus ferrugineus TaxID=354439 RepID=UPI003FCD098A